MLRALPAVGIGILLALALDLAIRRFFPPASTENRHWYLQTVQYHPVIGWSGYPGFVSTKDGIPIQTNSLGYRDREPAGVRDDQRLGVLVLGDSFTWGDEVRLEERFTSLLESSCGLLCDRLPAIRAINNAIIGYGTTQSFLDYLLAREKRPFEIVILALYTGNDLADNAGTASPSGPRPRLIRCEREDAPDGLCLEGVPVPPVVDWPEHRLINPRGSIARSFGWSGLVTLAAERRAPGFLIEKRLGDQTDSELKTLPFPIVKRTSDDPIEDRIGQLEAILRAMKRTIHGRDKAFGVMVFPSARVYSGHANDELRDYGEIVAVLNRLEIPFADFYGHTKGARLEDLYSGDQGHWRASGHEEAAKQLRSLLVMLNGRGKEVEPSR